MLLIEFEFRYFFIHCFKVITFLKFSRIHDRVYSASVRLLTRLDQMNQKDPKMMKKLILNDSIFILSFIKNLKPKFLQTYLVHKTKIVLKLGMPVGDIYCLWNTLRMLVVFNFDIFFFRITRDIDYLQLGHHSIACNNHSLSTNRNTALNFTWPTGFWGQHCIVVYIVSTK